MNIMQMGLASQQLIVSANTISVLPTDKTIAEIKSLGLRLVHKPENLVSLRTEQEKRRMQMCSSPEAA